MATPEDIERKLLCSICLHVLTEPKLLTCGHTYCLRCLQSHICHARSPEIVEGTMGFRCPVCREFIPAPDRISPPLDWASKYKTNYIVQDILDLHKETKKRRPLCPLHDGKVVELFCRDCMTAVCDRCVSLNHRLCTEVVELSTAVKERQIISNQQLAIVNKMIVQCEAKRRRCETGNTELDRIEHDVTQKIDKECHDIIKKVTSHVMREGERLKHELRGQCHAGRVMVRSYIGKCHELEQVLQKLRIYLHHKVNEFILPSASSQHDEQRVSVTLEKLGRAVHALENRCHFEVGLSLDDSVLTDILSNLHLGQINTIRISERVDAVDADSDDHRNTIADQMRLQLYQGIHKAFVPIHVQDGNFSFISVDDGHQPITDQTRVNSGSKTAPEQPFVAIPRCTGSAPQRQKSLPNQ